MKVGTRFSRNLCLLAVAGFAIAPLSALAQHQDHKDRNTHTQTKSQSRTTHRTTVDRHVVTHNNRTTGHSRTSTTIVQHNSGGRDRGVYNHGYRPSTIVVHDRNWGHSNHRYNQQSEWRNLALGAGFIGIIGLLEHDDTLFFAGAAGALYSTYRLDQDRNSDDRHLRARAYFFGRTDFWRDGVHYSRRTVDRSGRQYYQFYRD